MIEELRNIAARRQKGQGVKSFVDTFSLPWYFLVPSPAHIAFSSLNRSIMP